MELMRTFPTLTAEEKAQAVMGHIAAATRSYKDRVRFTLPNGHEAGPTLRTARIVVQLAQEGILLPVAVEAGSFVDLTEKAEQDRILAERFATFCVEDGLDPKNPCKASTGSRCDTCQRLPKPGEVLHGNMHFAPDGMGYPTPVMFTCNRCKA